MIIYGLARSRSEVKNHDYMTLQAGDYGFKTIPFTQFLQYLGLHATHQRKFFHSTKTTILGHAQVINLMTVRRT